MANLNQLKGKEEYQGIRVTEDYTPAELEMIRGMRAEAKALNDNDRRCYATDVVLHTTEVASKCHPRYSKLLGLFGFATPASLDQAQMKRTVAETKRR